MTVTHNISEFTLQDMAISMRVLRSLGADASSMEATANRIVNHIRDTFCNPEDGSKQLALVRFYKVHEFGKLPDELSSYANSKFPQMSLAPQTKCLVLLATTGDQPEWNSRLMSQGHQVIPLPNVEIIQTMPMVYQALSQLGLDLADIINPDKKFLVSEESRSYNVFYVPEALGSPYIPAQNDFVIPYSIRSVLGFGGMLPSGSLFVVIIFSKQPIPFETAEIFKSLAISVKVAVVPFDELIVFDKPENAV